MVVLGKSFYLEITFSHFVWLLYTKIITMFHRIWDALRWFPLRLNRIRKHVYSGMLHFSKEDGQSEFKKLTLTSIIYWWLEFGVLVLSIFGVAEIYETITDFVKFNTRSLTLWEKKLLRSIYGESINYQRVRIDNLGFIGPRQFRLCYVSFYTINSWGDISNRLLVHEMMHVWQYQKMGAVYIPRALAAQNSTMGYNYGGIPALEAAVQSGESLNAFNLEQQADIIADYYSLREGYRAQWSDAGRFDLPLYEHFVKELF